MLHRIDDGITDVTTSWRFVLGEHVERFEKTFAHFEDTGYCVALSSGTWALHCALLAPGIGEGDGVITVGHTLVATARSLSTGFAAHSVRPNASHLAKPENLRRNGSMQNAKIRLRRIREYKTLCEMLVRRRDTHE